MIETLKQVPEAFYSKAFYTDILRKAQGIGARFIAINILVNFLVFAAFVMPVIYQGTIVLRESVTNMPIVTFKSGKMSIDHATPYIIQLPKKADATKTTAESTKPADTVPSAFEVDPNYTDMNLDKLMKKMQDEHLIMLFTADKMVTLHNKAEVRVTDLSKTPDMIITQEKWAKIGGWIEGLALPLIVIFMLIGCIIGSFVRIFLGAIFVKLITMFMSIPPGFQASMRLAAVAAIPSAILTAPMHGGPAWVSFLIWFGYVLFGLVCFLKSQPKRA
ncbi:MAG TPA: DUF1189 family protein [Alphaproteobacteria bacterium]|nr:DUF1189 family protein [Alphaproteobacteria bacterium]